jgi:hypothetical protein
MQMAWLAGTFDVFTARSFQAISLASRRTAIAT